MAAKPQDGGTFFSVSYDLERQAEIQAEMSKTWNTDSGKETSGVHEFSEAMKSSYTSMLGRSRVDMRFTGEGLVIDTL